MNPQNQDDRTDIFATTQWSLILHARSDSRTGREALEELCHTYWTPLHRYISRRCASPDDARDLTQHFFQHMLQSDLLSGIHPDKGRFRPFLLACVKNFLASEWLRTSRQKRGGGAVHLSLDLCDYEAPASQAEAASFQHQFDKDWAHLMLERATQSIAAAYARDGRAAHFNALKEFLAGVGNESAYASAGEKIGISSAATSVAVCRLRERYKLAVRKEVANTLAAPDQVDDEMRYLLSIIIT